MALLNIGLVSKTLVNLFTEYYKISPAWGGTPPTISPQPPDRLPGDAVGVYLYHITEDNHFKNLSAPGNDTPSVRYSPMGLNLFYQLTAKSSSGEDAYLEQQMLGIAVKALHDYPVLDDSTAIGSTKIFPLELQGNGNRLRISLQPVAYNDAVSYWTAGSASLRLAAYYQVSVVLLEPEEPKIRSGRVLSYGVQTFVSGAPRLDTSMNSLSFSIPDSGSAQTVRVQPAQVFPANPAAPAAEHEKSKVIFKGDGLTGAQTDLFIRHSQWTTPEDVTVPWALSATGDQITATVRQQANGKDVVPGTYAAIVRVIKRVTTGGITQDSEHFSNVCPFTVIPRIDSVTGPDTTNRIIVTGYIFQHSGIPAAAVRVYVGQRQLIMWTSGAFSRGQFKIDTPSQITARLPDNLSSGQFYPLRVFVNDAESAPNWVRIP